MRIANLYLKPTNELNDTIAESHEKASLTLTLGTYTIGTSTPVIITILNEDGGPENKVLTGGTNIDLL